MNSLKEIELTRFLRERRRASRLQRSKWGHWCIGDLKSSPYCVDVELTVRIEIAERADTEGLNKSNI